MKLIKDLLKSKKFIVALGGILASIGIKLGLPAEVSDQLASTVLVLAATYIGAQGVADLGKEAEKAKQGD